MQIKAIQLEPQNPFTWSNGYSSPIYCDNRRILAFPDLRDAIVVQLAAGISKQFGGNRIPPLGIDLIAGVATSGIAFGVLVAEALKLPFAYVRPQAKEHGTKKQIEGVFIKGQTVVVVEDLISTGKSSISVVDILREAELEVVGLGAIFTYGFPEADKLFAVKKCPYFTLSDYETILEEAIRRDYISKQNLQILEEWKKDPKSWGKDKKN